MSKSVAILMCTYNGEKYLDEQLNSLLKQSYDDFVCYIHDDGSNDSTIEIINKYINLNSSKFVLLNFENNKHGASYNFMSLICKVKQFTTADYFLLSDQDDVWLDNKIEVSIDYLKQIEKQNLPALVYCDQIIVDNNLNIIAKSQHKYINKNEKDDSYKRIVFRNTAAGCCMCMNKQLFNIIADYSPNANIIMHDWWIMLVGCTCGKVKYIDIPLMLYRQHSKNTLGVDNNKYLKKIIRYILNFQEAINNRKKMSALCKMQVKNLPKEKIMIEYLNDVNSFISMCNRGKIYRMYYILFNGYLKYNNLFTLLFV